MSLMSSAARAAAFTLAGLVAASAAAQEPQRTTATFQDWLVQCRQSEGEPATAAPSAAAPAAAADPRRPAAPPPVAAKAAAPAAAAAPLGKVKVCEMVQTFTFRQTGSQLAKLAIGKLPGEDKVKAVLQTPVGVYLPAGVAIKLDDKVEYKGAYIRCTAVACLADIELPKDAEQAFTTAKAATLTFTNAARQPITLSLSLRGFDGAFKSAMAQQLAR